MKPEETLQEMKLMLKARMSDPENLSSQKSKNTTRSKLPAIMKKWTQDVDNKR